LNGSYKASWMQLTHDINATLKACAAHLQSAADPWWVIGSTAVALHGTDPGPINDIDLLVSVDDAKTFAKIWQCPNTSNSGSDRFRSQILLKPGIGQFPVEVMAGLQFMRLGQWNLLAPKTRQEIRFGPTRLFAPERTELIAILRSFGRKKDIRRAKLMQA